MKKKVLILLVVVLAITTGCGKIPKLENGQEAIISFKDDAISVDEFYQNLKDEYGLAIMVNMIDTYTVETMFPDYIDTAKEMAKKYIDLIAEDYESESELLRDIQTYTGFSSIESYEENMYLTYMKTYAAEMYTKENITEKKIENYYKENIKEDIEISHILITPDVTDDMSDDEIKNAEDKALEKANSIIKELKKTKDKNISNKFAELAKKYSEDEATKENGGSLGQINTDTLGSTYTDIVKASYTLKDGKYYAKVIKTTLGYHIIMRNKSFDKISLDEVKDDIIDALVEQKASEDNTIAINAIQHYRKKLGMEINDSKLNSEYSAYIQNSLAYALNQ